MRIAVATAIVCFALLQPVICSLGIVVARYKEPLDPWIPVADKVFLYAKGGIPQSNDSVDHGIFHSYSALPNIGREGHTYLTHIVEHYDDLQDIIIFSQADPFDLLSPVVNTTQQLVKVGETVGQDEIEAFNDSLFHDTDDWAKINWTDPKEKLWMTPSQLKTLVYSEYTPAQFWSLVFRECGHPAVIRSYHGAIFAVRRETLRTQPKDVWERALAEFNKANVVNPEIGFFWERFWAPALSKKYWLKQIERP